MGELRQPRQAGGDACLHGAERRREIADLVAALRVRDRRIVAGADAPNRSGDRAHGLGDSAREQKGHERGRPDAEQHDERLPLLHGAQRLERRRQRPLEHGHRAVVGTRRQVDDPRDRIVAELRVAVAVGRRVTIGDEIAHEVAFRGLVDRARARLPLAVLRTAQERDLEAGHVAHFARHRVVDLDAGGDPRHGCGTCSGTTTTW
jgi:hypothetical protein